MGVTNNSPNYNLSPAMKILTTSDLALPAKKTTDFVLIIHSFNCNKKTPVHNDRPAAVVQRCCQSSAASADVDVLSPVPPTPSAAVRAPVPAWFSPGHSTVAAAAARFEPVPCLTPVAQPAAELAAAPSLNILCPVEPSYAAFLRSHSASPALPASMEHK